MDLMALRHTKASTIAGEDGRGTRWERAAITLPEASRITTPIPAAPSSLKVAPSKLSFACGEMGGIHLILLGTEAGIRACVALTDRKSWSKEDALDQRLNSVTTWSSNLSEFLLFQISQKHIANRFTLMRSFIEKTIPNKSTKEENWYLNSFFNKDSGSQTTKRDGQDHRAWVVSSWPALQAGQRVEIATFHLQRL